MIRRILNRMGLDIVRFEDPFRLGMYEKLYTKEELARKPFINVGSGTFSHPYWTSVDYASDWYGTDRRIVHHDLMSLAPLPFPDASLKVVYTSHTIEHVSDQAVAVLFKEAFRVLEPGGILRVTTGPDAETDFRAVTSKDEEWFYWDHSYKAPGTYEELYHKPATDVPLAERWLHHVASQLAPNSTSPSERKYSAAEIEALLAERGMEATLDKLTSEAAFNPQRPGNHISWWTHGKIEKLMRDAGFTNVYRSGYRQSASPVMRQSKLFDSTHPQMSIYMEARK